jgi:hypothetical protein
MADPPSIPTKRAPPTTPECFRKSRLLNSVINKSPYPNHVAGGPNSQANSKALDPSM